MELKVWVEGIQRIVCGVTVNTTCQDVVFALAHATGKVGRFTLIERWRNNERLLAPNENPLKVLLKWGEYSNDVQFILQRSDQNQSTIKSDSNSNKLVQSVENNVKLLKNDEFDVNLEQLQQQKNSTFVTATDFLPFDRNKELRKSFGLNETKHPDNIGIVRGIPQTKQIISHSASSSMDSPTALYAVPNKIKSTTTTTTATTVPSSTVDHQPTLTIPSPLSSSSSSSCNQKDNQQYHHHNQTNITPLSKLQSNEFNMADVRNSLDRKTNSANICNNIGNNTMNFDLKNNNIIESLMDVLNCNKINISTDLYKNSPPISANGALVPPPYRDPPPPRSSPLHQLQQQQQQQQHNSQLHLQHNQAQTNNNNNNNCKKFDFKDNINMTSYFNLNEIDLDEAFFQNAQYKDLIQLIKFQREKINSQQADLTKFDAEIIYLENKERDEAQQLEAIAREISKAEQLLRQGSEQLQSLQYVEEENELVKQQEKTLKSEITLLRSKLANCETELLQCKNKIRLLMDDIQLEQRALSNRQKDSRQNLERSFLAEIEKIQSEIDQTIQNADKSNKTAENLKVEVQTIENAIAEKKRQLEQLVNELKEVNLQSLTVTASEEIKHLLEGSNRPGSTRRIIGSPRQLENAVPTSKNPHGVWV